MGSGNPLGVAPPRVAGRIGLGGAPLGNLFRAISDAQARETIDCAWELGIRLFDTAPFYGLGLSEHRLGDALRVRPRDEFVLSTKAGRLLDPDRSASPAAERFGFVAPLPFTVRFDYSYDGIMRSHDVSLQRLGLSRIDILLVHDIGRETHGEMAERHFADLANSGYRALDELRAAGTVGAIGLGVNEWQVCEQAMQIGRWDKFLLAGRYTLLEQHALDSFLPKCARHGATVILGGVYNSGILATGTRGPGHPTYNYAPAPDHILARVARIETICATFGVPLAAAALQFPLAHPLIEAVIPGAGEPRLVRETLALAAQPIPSAFWDALVAAGLLAAAAPVPQGACL